MNSLIRMGGMAGIAIGLGACGTLYKLDVTAYNNPNHDLGKTYVILSGSPELDINSAEFDQYAKQVERALETKGYERMPGDDLSSVALGVYLSADVGDASKRVHTVTTGIYESPYAENSTAVVRASGNTGSGQGSQQPPPVVTPPPEALTGYEETGFATTVYTKHLNLVAIDLQKYLKDIAAVGKSEALPTEIWSIDVETTGKPSDLRQVIPVMVAAGQPYMTGRTDDIVQVKISETDKRVSAIKGEN